MSPTHLAADEFAGWLRDRRESFTDRSNSRFLVGVCGPPGAGKSTIAELVGDQLDVPIVPMDGFHLPNDVLDERGLRAMKGAPATFDADGFVAAVRTLAAAGAPDVWLPSFDRVADEPQPDAIRVPASAGMVVVEGNYLLLDDSPWSELTGLIDVFAYVDLDDDVRISRLVARHVEFGRSPDDALMFVQHSDERNAALVAAVRYRADVIVTTGAPHEP